MSKFPNRRWAKFMLWARRMKLAGRIEILLSGLAIISAIVTYVALANKSGPLNLATGSTMSVLMGINLALLLALGVSIGRWIVRSWISRKGMAAGSRLHVRVTRYFTGIAIIPPIIMAIFSALFFDISVDSWSEKMRFALNTSLDVADTYRLEHRANIGKDLTQVSSGFNLLSPFQQGRRRELQLVADAALTARSLSEIVIFAEDSGGGFVLARANDRLSLQTTELDPDLTRGANSGRPVIAFDEANNRVVGIVKLSSFFKPTYLYVARDFSPNVLGYLSDARTALDEYSNLEGQRSDILFQFNLVFIIIAMLILFASIWLGLWFSSRLVTPISNLVDAAERVGKGDLDVRVPYVASGDEVGTLSRAFNRMTDQLARHQRDLIAANLELEERRKFLEEVLDGVSAGVVGLQHDGTVFLPNRSASSLLGMGFDSLIGRRLDEVVPEFAEVLRQAEQADFGLQQDQIQIDVEGETRTLLVRVMVERDDATAISGYVVTFDDLTEQLATQRTAAWADVARRIAHEIKNPLTPIQLATERLKRKYLKVIPTDTKVFSQCTDTIIRQVGDLRRMVDEFSSFARMPAPILKDADITDMVKQAVFLQGVGTTKIQFTTSFVADLLPIKCDHRLVGQALTNILKNAVESVTARVTTDAANPGGESPEGAISVEVEQDCDHTKLIIVDNGLGLPQEQKDRLMEPYVTTRVKGTGLGLAIVRRIMEEHGGTVRIADMTPSGARVVLSFSHAALEVKFEQENNGRDVVSSAAE